MTSPKVSIAFVTFNHERYVAQALQSVLMQETTFPFEIVIGEDCSLDSTRQIVLDYQMRFPEKIKVLLHPRNLGGARNFCEVLNVCSGKYIHFLEGDDYWTDKTKLQKQVAFLDSQPQFAFCFHNFNVLHHTTGISHPALSNLDGSVPFSQTLEDVLAYVRKPGYGVFHLSATLYRRNAILPYPAWLCRQHIIDIALICLALQHGNGGYIGDVMSTYRIHNAGIWQGSGILSQSRSKLAIFEALDSHFGYKYSKTIQITRRQYSLVTTCYAYGEYDTALMYLKRAFGSFFRDRSIGLGVLISTGMKLMIKLALSRKNSMFQKT